MVWQCQGDRVVWASVSSQNPDHTPADPEPAALVPVAVFWLKIRHQECDHGHRDKQDLTTKRYTML